MKLSDLNPFIRYARAHRVAFRLQRDFSVCYDCRVFFFDNVSGSIVINGQVYELHNKSVLFLPPKTVYKFNILFKENATVIILDFDLTNENEHLQASLGTATVHTFDPNAVPPYALPEELHSPIVRVLPQAEHMLMQSVENFLFKNSCYREVSSALLKLCLLEMIRQKPSAEQTDICKAVLTYVHKNYSNSSLSNKEIAAKFGYHPDHLSTLIKQETGKSLHRYLINYRLQIAKNYLLTTQYDISEIAWRCGFCTPAYFIKLFRENTGTTPRSYRKLQIHTEL